MSIPTKIDLNRDTIRSGHIRSLIRAHATSYRVLTDEELHASLTSMFPEDGPQGDAWLFGYGSLIWNPTIHFAESRCATAHGYHRRFCLQTHLGRGSPETPGLTLGLDRGGCCRGVAFRIPRETALEELEIVWRREMVSDAYIPRWLTLSSEEGPIRAIGFVMNRDHERYVGQLPEEEMARTIERAHGFLGPCAEYLFNTVEHLDELGIPDRGLTRLRDRVSEIRSAAGDPSD
ncbi:gamma-glutamylcyclotransferase [Nisaea acidiphila]|uniref:glutathione-specific gamma-glutamylcyclotransferase n=1 Tax=Nisaea acidiphila TaxID=1862145 RepID=A0A9J7B0A7_9PROT|nr:gamma-glutamylcyclotransferase [Nisaea acidiphila]UUX51916.1 gamma-glutamylcyclotransferase [Nisaea acidiphila]